MKANQDSYADRAHADDFLNAAIGAANAEALADSINNKPTRYDLVKVSSSDYHHDHVMEEDERGDWVPYEKRFDSLFEVRNALEAAEQILKRSQQISTNDSGKFRGVTTSSALIEVRAALAKLTDGSNG